MLLCVLVNKLAEICRDFRYYKYSSSKLWVNLPCHHGNMLHECVLIVYWNLAYLHIVKIVIIEKTSYIGVLCMLCVPFLPEHKVTTSTCNELYFC